MNWFFWSKQNHKIYSLPSPTTYKTPPPLFLMSQDHLDEDNLVSSLTSVDLVNQQILHYYRMNRRNTISQIMQPILTSIENRGLNHRWVDNLGHHLIARIEVFINGWLVSSYNPEPWFQLYEEINQANPPNTDQIPIFKTNTLLLK